MTWLPSDSAGDSADRRQRLTIGQIARLTSVSAKAIRYYESIGLLPRAPRGDNRYRRYGQADVNRLVLLARLRQLGVSLSAARDLLAESSSARCAQVRRDLLALIGRRLADLDQEIAALRALRSAVVGYQSALGACQADDDTSFSACLDLSCVAPGAGATPRIEVDTEIESLEECHAPCCDPCCAGGAV